jgi:hypothetical protein
VRIDRSPQGSASVFAGACTAWVSVMDGPVWSDLKSVT